MKLTDIATELGIKDSQVRKWKSVDAWDKVTLPMAKGSVTNKKGGQPGNKNAAGNNGGSAPLRNNNAEKHGLFRKWLPEETFSIIEEMPADPLDVLWDQIQIAYAAIVRAQRIMYVKDHKDKTIEKVGEKRGKISGEEWEVQQAWDKQATFLKAQARAQGELRSMIKQYDELLHKRGELASEEQRARIENVRAATAKIKGEDPDEGREDDGFLAALRGEATAVWQE